VAPTPVRVNETEEYLAGAVPGEESFAHAARMAMEASSPISDVRSSAKYQRAMVRNMTARALREVWARMQEGG
jgi:carbon-monoxide dehydrogenase medium subunit